MVSDDILERVDRASGQAEFTTLQAAQYVGCSKGYLISLRTLGGGPAFHRRFKRKGIYYLRSDLDEWRVGTRYLSTSGY